MTIPRCFPKLAVAILLLLSLSGCMREVVLNPEPEISAGVKLPVSARIELGQVTAVSNAANPIHFDVKPALVSYAEKRHTFARIVDGPADVTLKVSAQFIFGSGTTFYYTFKLKGEIIAKGRTIGQYSSEATARGGMIRLSAAADQEPTAEAFRQALDKLFSLIESDRPQIMVALGREKVPNVVAEAPPAAVRTPSAVSPGVDQPKYHRESHPDDLALVVGIEKYSRLPEARFAENDAAAVKRHLLALGYPERNIILLKGAQATRGAIQGYVEEWLPRNAKPDSRVFVYFSGHGSPDPKNGDAYLVPWDGDAMFLKSTAYPLKTLYASLGKLKARKVVVVLDSCFSGAGGRSVLAEGARPLVVRAEETAVPDRLTVLSAASGDEITATVPERAHGAFTYYLLEAFNEGKLTTQAAFAQLKPRVQDEARRQNREQTPLLLGDDASF